LNCCKSIISNFVFHINSRDNKGIKIAVLLKRKKMIENGTLLQNRYLTEKQIGAGGMGAVYLAIDQRFESFVAIKETFYKDDELSDAFEREAKLLNSLHHPNLPHVSDYFTEADGHFLVMQFIEGEDLFEILKREGSFPMQDVLHWTNSLLGALDYLHSQEPPIIHRDIKPQNLKITTRGDIILLDFGLAKLNSDDTQAQLSVFGYSRKYSPLEQIQGTGTDARSDIFALGATVYHLLTGKAPVDVLARASAIVAGNTDPLQLASEINDEMPIGIASVINSALALNAAARYVSAKAMRQALENAVNADLPAKTEELPEEVLAPVPIENGVIVSAENENFPALEAFAAEVASSSRQTDNTDKLEAVEIPTVNSQAFSSVPEVLPQSPLVVEKATRVSIPRSNQSRFSLATLLVLLSCVGLATGYFFTRANSSDASNQSASTESVPASSPGNEQSASAADSINSGIADAPSLTKTAQSKSTRVKTEQIAEKPETVAKRETDVEPPLEIETPEKTRPVAEKPQTPRPAPRKAARRGEAQQEDESRTRVVEDPVPDIESIFTGRPADEGGNKVRRPDKHRQQGEQMSDEELKEMRRQRREERRRRGNENNFPY
jgi:serine/threonine protein kinase